MDETAQAQVDAAIALASSLVSDGTDWDSVMAALRSEGFKMIEAVGATMAVLELGSGAAVRRVIESPAWEDHREAVIGANEACRQAAKEWADVWREDDDGWEAIVDLERR